MSEGRPLVSICIPTYNSERFLAATLESIAAQSYPRVEVIIGDNASADGTIGIAECFAARHGWRLLKNPLNLGPMGNWSRLVTEATGDYVAIYHADDLYHPDIVAESVTFLEREPEAGLVGTLGTVIDAGGRELHDIELPDGCHGTGCYSFPELFRAVLGNGGSRIFLVTPSVMVRRTIYSELGTFDTSGRFASAADYEMWFRIGMRRPIGVIDRPLMRYRIHGGQGSENELRRNLELPDMLEVLAAYADGIDDLELQIDYDRYRSRTFLKTALKQNCVGDFKRSSETVHLIRSGRYLPAGMLVAMANRLEVNLRYWPGRTWPNRLPAGGT